MNKIPVITQRIIPLNSNGSAYIKFVQKDGKDVVKIKRIPFLSEDTLFKHPYAKKGYELNITNFETGRSTNCKVTKSTFPLDRRIDGVSIPADEEAFTISVMRKQKNASGKIRFMRKFKLVKSSQDSLTEITHYSKSGKVLVKDTKHIENNGIIQLIERILEKFNPGNMKKVPFGSVQELIVKENGFPVANTWHGTTFRVLPQE